MKKKWLPRWSIKDPAEAEKVRAEVRKAQLVQTEKDLKGSH